MKNIGCMKGIGAAIAGTIIAGISINPALLGNTNAQISGQIDNAKINQTILAETNPSIISDISGLNS